MEISNLINDKDLLVIYCRDLDKQNLAIRAILVDQKLNAHINELCKSNLNIATEQVMHDTILSFIRIAQKPEFAITDSPQAYLKKIAKNTFLMLLRRESRQKRVNNVDHNQQGYNQEYFIHYDRREVVDDVMRKINDDCREVLLLWARKFKLKEIAQKMNYTSDKYAKKKKHLCLKKLIAIIDADPKLKAELKEYV